jgi:hypothetical protein
MKLKREESLTRLTKKGPQNDLQESTARSRLGHIKTLRVLQSIPTLIYTTIHHLPILDTAFFDIKMATRCAHENSNEIGVFAALTNAYCLTGKWSFCRSL